MLGMTFDYEKGASVVWGAVLTSLLFAAGLTALAILRRWKWAYSFGAAYASASILVGAWGVFANAGGVRDNLSSAAIQHVVLACFLVHLVRNRHTWRFEASNKPLHPPSGAEAPGEDDRLRRAARG